MSWSFSVKGDRARARQELLERLRRARNGKGDEDPEVLHMTQAAERAGDVIDELPAGTECTVSIGGHTESAETYNYSIAVTVAKPAPAAPTSA